jgi:hypothetical protein
MYTFSENDKERRAVLEHGMALRDEVVSRLVLESRLVLGEMCANHPPA